jgi:hypothetical protein
MSQVFVKVFRSLVMILSKSTVKPNTHLQVRTVCRQACIELRVGASRSALSLHFFHAAAD